MRKQKDGFTGERSLVLPESRIRELLKNPWFEALYLTDIGITPAHRTTIASGTSRSESTS